MTLKICKDQQELGKLAGARAVGILVEAIDKSGEASLIAATGTSQFELLQYLIRSEQVDWSKVVMFHLDEYIGLPESHPASFRKYLKERFLNHLPQLKNYHLINGEAVQPLEECARLGNLISGYQIDLGLVGIGENGHLAFNDPPADLETIQPYIVVELDEACRRQQVGEGWFPSIADVPAKAISMSVHQIMAARNIICSVPGKRKAQPVKDSLEGPVSNWHPASVLQNHLNCTIFLDPDSASLLSTHKS